jgi:4-aminobutyrate--pyruvate transaminase
LITRSLGDTLALCPPLIINDAQIGDLLGRYAKALDDTQAWLGQQGLSAG